MPASRKDRAFLIELSAAWGLAACVLGLLLFWGERAHAKDKTIFPTFAELVGFQDDAAGGTGTGTTGDSGGLGEGVEIEDVDPELFASLAEDLLTQSEIGTNRPGEISLRPDRALKVGSLRLYPLLRQTFILDDNIFLTDTVNGERSAGNPNPHVGSRESDLISRTDAGFLSQLDFGDGDHHFDFGGQISHNEFTRRSLEYREEYVGGSVVLTFNRVRLQVGDRWEHRFDPIEIEFTDKLERTINTAFASAGFEGDDFGFEVDFVREDTRFIGFEQTRGVLATTTSLRNFDRAETRVEVRPMVRLTDSLWGFIEYAYLRRMVDEQALPDSDANRFSFGVRGDVNERLRVLARLGWIDEDFETDAFSIDGMGNIIPFVDSRDSRNGDVQANVQAIYDLEDLTRIELNYIRLSQFATSSNFQMLDRADLSILRQFYPNVLGRFGTFYEYVRPSNIQNSSRVGAGVGVQYLISSLISLNADYAYRRRNSSLRGGDFSNHVLAFGATVRF